MPRNTETVPDTVSAFSVVIAAAFSLKLFPLYAGERKIGVAQADITPDCPVALTGGRTAPISKGVNSTPRALAGKGYSAIPQSCRVGPEGGQILVDRTAVAIQKLFNE